MDTGKLCNTLGKVVNKKDDGYDGDCDGYGQDDCWCIKRKTRNHPCTGAGNYPYPPHLGVEREILLLFFYSYCWGTCGNLIKFSLIIIEFFFF
jgi:hypothetical protein